MLKVLEQPNGPFPAEVAEATTGGSRLKNRRTRKALKVVKMRCDPAIAKLLQKTAEQLQGALRSVEAVCVIRSLEVAATGGADAMALESLAQALMARAGDLEAVKVVEELASLLCENYDPSVLHCLARDLEKGADPDLIGALAGYLKAGLAPNQIGALAWFFPRKQILRQGPLRKSAVS